MPWDHLPKALSGERVLKIPDFCSGFRFQGSEGITLDVHDAICHKERHRFSVFRV